jgi:hypothetical protein
LAQEVDDLFHAMLSLFFGLVSRAPAAARDCTAFNDALRLDLDFGFHGLAVVLATVQPVSDRASNGQPRRVLHVGGDKSQDRRANQARIGRSGMLH